jgi:transposase
MGRPSKWSPEFREEAVRMYRESEESIAAVTRRLGLGPETFRRWVREDEVERGQRDGITREKHAEIVKLRREVRRLEEGEADPAEGGRVFRAGDRSAAMTFQLIDQERAHHAVSRLCSVLNVTRQLLGLEASSGQPPSRRGRAVEVADSAGVYDVSASSRVFAVIGCRQGSDEPTTRHGARKRATGDLPPGR